MPSHKRRKKKKSHKRSKRHSSSSSEEDTCSPWRVPLSDAESDALSNEEQLTTLVRKTYITHLKQALTLNFENILNSSGSGAESVEEMSNKWSQVLEQKALRTCMISELYRTSMVSLIKQVKTSTNEKKLYVEDTILSRLKSKVPVNKLSQTEFIKLNQEVATQTEMPTPSMVELPLPKLSSSERPYDPEINFSDSDSNDGGVSSSIGSIQPQSNLVRSRNQDICNISSTSDLPGLADLPTQEYRVKSVSTDIILGEKRPINKCEDTRSSDFSNMEFPTGNPEIQNIPNEKLNNSNNKSNTNSKTLISVKKRRISFEKNSSNTNNNLDERLTALGLMVDNEDDSMSQPIGKSKRSNWFAEETAQSCNLTRILMRMTSKQREKVMKKIKDLFGDENDPLTELSEANIAICRKRIASVVVSELTPVYQGKRIASRHLFKYFAKKITRSIMEQSLAPDTKDIRWRVKKYFEDGKVIMSEADCT